MRVVHHRCQRWRLLRDGDVVDLSPRLVEILAFLASQAGDTVTKNQLLDRFWPDVHVTENTVTRAVADIRKALDDDPRAPRVIQTVAREVRETRADTIYGREFVANAWVASGFIHLRRAAHAEARGAFESAMQLVPRYGRALLGCALLPRLDDRQVDTSALSGALEELRAGGKSTEASLVSAARDAWTGDLRSAVSTLDGLLDSAPPGSAGWSVSADPLLAPLHSAHEFPRVLSRIAALAA